MHAVEYGWLNGLIKSGDGSQSDFFPNSTFMHTMPRSATLLDIVPFDFTPNPTDPSFIPHGRKLTEGEGGGGSILESPLCVTGFCSNIL